MALAHSKYICDNSVQLKKLYAFCLEGIGVIFVSDTSFKQKTCVTNRLRQILTK